MTWTGGLAMGWGLEVWSLAVLAEPAQPEPAAVEHRGVQVGREAPELPVVSGPLG